MRAIAARHAWLLVLGLGVLAPERAAAEPAPPTSAAAPDTPEAPLRGLYGRVVVDESPLRTGPGVSFRQVGVARRGEVYRIVHRGTTGYWWEVERPDGTRAFVLGDALYAVELSPEEAHRGRFLPRLFAPAPLPDSHGEISLGFGALGDAGLVTLRVGFLLAPTFGFELTGGAAVSSSGRLFLAGVGGVVNLAPRSPVVPYVAVGGGLARSAPNADSFLLDAGTLGMLYGGGGLRFCFQKRITLRVEARTYEFFEPDRQVTKQEWSGGLTVFF